MTRRTANTGRCFLASLLIASLNAGMPNSAQGAGARGASTASCIRALAPPRLHCSITVANYDPLSGAVSQPIVAKVIKMKKHQAKPLVAQSTIQNIRSNQATTLIDSNVRARPIGWRRSEGIQDSGPQPGGSRKLKFELAPSGKGELISSTDRGQSLVVVTDPQGNAPVTLQAGSRSGPITLTVTDVTEYREPDEDRVPWSATFEVEKGFWEKHRTKIILGGIAAAVIAIVDRRRTKPIQQNPPPVIP